jgi:hypothetical protein
MNDSALWEFISYVFSVPAPITNAAEKMSFNEPRIMDQILSTPSSCMQPSSWIHQNHTIEQWKCAAYVGVSRITFPPTTHFGIRAFSGLVFFSTIENSWEVYWLSSPAVPHWGRLINKLLFPSLWQSVVMMLPYGIGFLFPRKKSLV